MAQKLVEQPLRLFPVHLPHRAQQRLLHLKRIRRALPGSFELLDVCGDLSLNLAGVLTLHHAFVFRDVIEKPHRHEQQIGQFVDLLRRKIRHRLQRVDNSIQPLRLQMQVILQVADDIVLTVDHQKRPYRQLGAHGRIAQNGRSKTGQPHRAEIDIFPAEPCGFGHPEDVRLHAVLRRSAGGTTELAACAAEACFIMHSAGRVGHHTAHAAGRGKCTRAITSQLEVKRFSFLHPARLPPAFSRLFAFYHVLSAISNQNGMDYNAAKKYKTIGFFTRPLLTERL